MAPAQLFSFVLLITAAAITCELLLRKFHRKRLQSIAREWGMNYSPVDQFRLTARVARGFPIPGAANIRVVDLIYGSTSDSYRYLFTAEYTAGVLTHKHRVMRVGAFSEAREKVGPGAETGIVLAPKNLPLIEQYRALAPDIPTL